MRKRHDRRCLRRDFGPRAAILHQVGLLLFLPFRRFLPVVGTRRPRGVSGRRIVSGIGTPGEPALGHAWLERCEDQYADQHHFHSRTHDLPPDDSFAPNLASLRSHNSMNWRLVTLSTPAGNWARWSWGMFPQIARRAQAAPFF